MSSVNPIGYQNCVDNFGNQLKLEKSIESACEGDFFKMTKHTVTWIFDIVTLSSALPLFYVPIFQAIKSVTNMVFESIDIVKKAKTVYKSSQKLKLCNRKIEKWNEKHLIVQRIREGDRQELAALKNDCEKKLRDLDFTNEENAKMRKIRAERWNFYIDLINEAEKMKDGVAENKLADLMEYRHSKKITEWTGKTSGDISERRKAFFDIVTCVGSIALEVLTLIAVAFSTIDGGATYIIIKTVTGVSLGVLKLGKQIWWDLHKKESKDILALHSFEQIATTIVKYCSLPDSPFFQSAVIKGLTSTCIAAKRIFEGGRNLYGNKEILDHCKTNIRQLEKKKNTFNQINVLVLEGDSDELKRIRDEYQARISETEQMISQINTQRENLHNESDRDELSTMCGIMNADLKDWYRGINVMDKAIRSHSIKDAKAVARHISGPTESELKNWKLNEKFHQQKNTKAWLSAAVNVAEIARFILLSLAITLTLVGVGINLLPALIVAGIIANLAFLTCYFLNGEADKKMNVIRESWCAA